MGVITTWKRALAGAGSCAVAIAIMVSGTPAYANRDTEQMRVRLSVRTSCKLDATDMAFGFPLKGVKTATSTATVKVRCTPGTPYAVKFDQGLHYDAKDRTRRMYGGQAEGVVWYAPYRLYRDPARLLPIDATSILSGTILATGERAYTVYGTADLRNLRASGYHDTVGITLEF